MAIELARIKLPLNRFHFGSCGQTVTYARESRNTAAAPPGRVGPRIKYSAKTVAIRFRTGVRLGSYNDVVRTNFDRVLVHNRRASV